MESITLIDRIPSTNSVGSPTRSRRQVDYIRLLFAHAIIHDHGAASPTSGRGAQP
jgi:hypothetical protein